MVHDHVSSIFFLIVSIVVFAVSIKLGLGTLQHPGPGFITFGASGLLGILSLIAFLRAFLNRERSREVLFADVLWWRVVLSGMAILGYALVLKTLGFLITTFLLMFFLYWIPHEHRWYRIAIYSLLSSLASYYLFAKLLKCQLPDGLFGL